MLPLLAMERTKRENRTVDQVFYKSDNPNFDTSFPLKHFSGSTFEVGNQPAYGLGKLERLGIHFSLNTVYTKDGWHYNSFKLT